MAGKGGTTMTMKTSEGHARQDGEGCTSQAQSLLCCEGTYAPPLPLPPPPTRLTLCTTSPFTHPPLRTAIKKNRTKNTCGFEETSGKVLASLEINSEPPMKPHENRNNTP